MKVASNGAGHRLVSDDHGHKGLGMTLKLKSTAAMVLTMAIQIAYAQPLTLSGGSPAGLFDPEGSGRSVDLLLVQGTSSFAYSNGTGEVGGVPTSVVGAWVGGAGCQRHTTSACWRLLGGPD